MLSFELDGEAKERYTIVRSYNYETRRERQYNKGCGIWSLGTPETQYSTFRINTKKYNVLSREGWLY
ncbi:unnamed protein product [Rhizophagus irregularis]|nr:unnamed protein product [Rhizophagus irregularis]